jgi:threonine/homoserine/homoserine lactone efflux protein
MDAATALPAGFVSGLAIATQFGAVSALLLETTMTAGPRAGAAAGLGVATVDLGFAAVAVVAGGTARAALAGHETELKAAAAVTLAAIALRGLRSLMRGRSPSKPARAHVGPPPRRHASPSAQYVRFLTITTINPLTIVSFASVAASLSLTGFFPRAAFVTGVGAASASWHLVLTLVAGHAGRRITPPMRRALAVGGRVVVLAMAVRFALAIRAIP